MSYSHIANSEEMMGRDRDSTHQSLVNPHVILLTNSNTELAQNVFVYHRWNLVLLRKFNNVFTNCLSLNLLVQMKSLSNN